MSRGVQGHDEEAIKVTRRIGSLRIFCEMSVIAVFPLKMGDLMFVGFDSQNTSHSFPHYPNWNLGVREISLIGFREWSGDHPPIPSSLHLP
jgi:hypothetical protein